VSVPALALALVLPASTGTGASTATARPVSHRNHASRENTDGKKESGEPGRFAAFRGPGVSLFPLSSAPSRHAAPGRP
jgi:hypothetical protein